MQLFELWWPHARGPVSLRTSANDDCSLNHDPLWLRSGIELVRSAVKPNSAETCSVEAQRNCLGQQNEVEMAEIAHNTT